MCNVLISRDSKNKIRIVKVKNEYLNDTKQWIIHRESGIYGGKITKQPDKVIVPKAKRTPLEQLVLEHDSLVKGYLDKGYIDVTEAYNNEGFDSEALLPKTKTDQNGGKKPMLCKKYSDVKPEIFNAKWFTSRKLDGVRCLVRYENGVLKTSSRGGTVYDIPATYILQDETLVKFMNEHPDYILDGEIYYHGSFLELISGLCRKQTLEEGHKKLQYWVYDLVMEDKTFLQRKSILDEMKTYFDGNEKIVICDHVETKSVDEIWSLHNAWVSDGFEGAVARKADSLYKCNGRGSDWVKFKKFISEDFKIVGYELGLRGVEDMSFIMELPDGRTFNAKPIGDRQTKLDYFQNIDSIIGKMGEVKFFHYSNDKIPNLPSFRCVRWDLEN